LFELTYHIGGLSLLRELRLENNRLTTLPPEASLPVICRILSGRPCFARVVHVERIPSIHPPTRIDALHVHADVCINETLMYGNRQFRNKQQTAKEVLMLTFVSLRAGCAPDEPEQPRARRESPHNAVSVACEGRGPGSQG